MPGRGRRGKCLVIPHPACCISGSNLQCLAYQTWPFDCTHIKDNGILIYLHSLLASWYSSRSVYILGDCGSCKFRARSSSGRTSKLQRLQRAASVSPVQLNVLCFFCFVSGRQEGGMIAPVEHGLCQLLTAFRLYQPSLIDFETQCNGWLL